MGHDVFPAQYCISFNSKLWKPKPHVRLEQTLNVCWTSMHNEQTEQSALQHGKFIGKNSISSDR